jgi:hypothetical protein
LDSFCPASDPPPNKYKQLVSITQETGDGQYQIRFGTVVTKISPQCFTPWTYLAGQDMHGQPIYTVTSGSPFFHILRTISRIATGKPRLKDMKKMTMLNALTNTTLATGIDHYGTDYGREYDSWLDFVESLKNCLDVDIRLKSKLMQLWWNNPYFTGISAFFAHSALTAHLANSFSGRKS